ncbi:MAG: hypothetical protein GEEBNDBF_02552 [bacterium]|nr:hypothetical protein [bacterium]
MRNHCFWLLLCLFVISAPAIAKDEKDAAEDVGQIIILPSPAGCPLAIAKLEMEYRETSKEVSQERGGGLFEKKSINTFQRPRGLDNRFWITNSGSQAMIGTEFVGIYFDAFGGYLNTVSFYSRKLIEPTGKQREVKGAFDFPGAGYTSRVVLFPYRIAFADGSTWRCDLVQMQTLAEMQAGVTLTLEQMEPAFRNKPQGTDPVRNYLQEPVMLAE